MLLRLGASRRDLARQFSQSRVAKMEAGDASVSLDLMIRTAEAVKRVRCGRR
jgi:hypothetical protein